MKRIRKILITFVHSSIDSQSTRPFSISFPNIIYIISISGLRADEMGSEGRGSDGRGPRVQEHKHPMLNS